MKNMENSPQQNTSSHIDRGVEGSSEEYARLTNQLKANRDRLYSGTTPNEEASEIKKKNIELIARLDQLVAQGYNQESRLRSSNDSVGFDYASTDYASTISDHFPETKIMGGDGGEKSRDTGINGLETSEFSLGNYVNMTDDELLKAKETAQRMIDEIESTLHPLRNPVNNNVVVVDDAYKKLVQNLQQARSEMEKIDMTKLIRETGDNTTRMAA